MPAPDSKRRLTAFLVALAVLVATPLAVVAADAFTDVPDTNVFHEDIAWLAEAGVTKGCNPPDNTEFCPGDNVTREQMAAFMRRLAVYIDAEDGTPGLADHATTADSSTTAGDAESVNGVAVERFFAQVTPNTADEVIGTYGPITLKGSCDAGGDPILRASWDEEVNHMTFEGSSGAQFGNASVDAGETINIASGQFGTVGLAEAIGYETNIHTSVEYFLRPAPALGDDMCFFSGYVTVG